MISILIPRKAVIKKIVLKKLMVFHSRFSGKEILTNSCAGDRSGKVCRITPVGEGKRAEMCRGRREVTLHSVTGFCGAREQGGPGQSYKLGKQWSL